MAECNSSRDRSNNIKIDNMIKYKIILTILVGALWLGSCSQQTSQKEEVEHPNLTKLKNQTAEFRPEIIKMNEQVYVAVGYDGSNSAMIIGDDGVIIIDALRSLGAAEKVEEAFKQICDKPVVALIYTHGHQDHTGGTSAFVGANKAVQIIAREGFKEELQEHSPVEKILAKRNARQFGRNLPDSEIINRGVTAGRTPTDRVGKGYIAPNRTFSDSLVITIAGIDLELYAVNAETNDHLFVWTPSLKALFTGDNYYKAFPNLYAIRGSRYRDVKSWGEVVKIMSTFPVEHLVPGHTRPLTGAANVHQNLTNYASAILSVYEQTIACMNKGYTVQKAVESVKLPADLREQDNLQEFYGSVAWGVRSIFAFYVGWFDGNPTHLYPLELVNEAAHIVKMAGGEEKVLAHLNSAFEDGDYQWGLQLSDYLLQLNYKAGEVIVLKIALLRKLAAQQINAPARNYYLSFANELEAKL